MFHHLLPIVAAIILGVSPVRPWIVGGNELEPIGSSVSEGIVGRVVDPTTGIGLFNPDLDESVVGQDPDGTEYPRGTDMSFSAPIRRQIQTLVINGDFSIGPPDPTLPINSDPADADYNPLPGWRLVLDGDQTVATWVEDAAAASGYALRIAPTGSSSSHAAVFQQLVAVPMSAGQRYSIAGSVYSAFVGSSGNRVWIFGQFYQRDGVTAIGSEVSETLTTFGPAEITIDFGRVPTDAAYLLLRFGIDPNVFGPATFSSTYDFREIRLVAIPAELLFSGAKTYRTATQSIPDSTDTTVTFPSGSATEEYDTDEYHSDATNTGRMVIQQDGYHEVQGSIEWATSGVGNRNLSLVHVAAAGGTETVLDQDRLTAPGGGAQEFQDVHGEGYWLKGDYLILRVNQTSGGALNINGNGQRTHFTIHRSPGGSPSSPTASGGGALTDHTHAATGSGATGGGDTLEPGVLVLPNTSPTALGSLARGTTSIRMGSGTGTLTYLPITASDPEPLVPGGAASQGVTNEVPRVDHVHAYPDPWPVGSVFLAVVSTDPATLLGYGTWTQIAGGRVLVGQTGSDADFDTAEETGGSKTSSHTHDYTQVVQHAHTVSITDPGHQHGEGYRNTGTAGTAGVQGASTANNANIANGVQSNTTGITASTANPAGSVATGTTASAAPSIVQPYLVVYIWKRTA